MDFKRLVHNRFFDRQQSFVQGIKTLYDRLPLLPDQNKECSNAATIYFCYNVFCSSLLLSITSFNFFAVLEEMFCDRNVFFQGKFSQNAVQFSVIISDRTCIYLLCVTEKLI